eukprot:3470277-Pleurochrysis_carterae.AAC.2
MFCGGLVDLRATFGAVLVPVVTLAPPARSPFVAPLFICFRPRALRVGWLATSVLAVVLLAAYRESMCGARIGFKFMPHISNLCVAQHAACSRDGESDVTDACVERKLHIKQGRQAIAQAAESVCNLFRHHRIGQLCGNGKRTVEPLNRVNESVECRHSWLRDAADLEGMIQGCNRSTGGRQRSVCLSGENAQKFSAAAIASQCVRSLRGGARDGLQDECHHFSVSGLSSISSGAMMYLFASSAVSGARPEEETGPPVPADAAVLAAVGAAED